MNRPSGKQLRKTVLFHHTESWGQVIRARRFINSSRSCIISDYQSICRCVCALLTQALYGYCSVRAYKFPLTNLIVHRIVRTRNYYFVIYIHGRCCPPLALPQPGCTGFFCTADTDTQLVPKTKADEIFPCIVVVLIAAVSRNSI